MPTSLLVAAIPTARGADVKGAFPHDAILGSIPQSTHFDVSTVHMSVHVSVPDPNLYPEQEPKRNTVPSHPSMTVVAGQVPDPNCRSQVSIAPFPHSEAPQLTGGS